MARRLAAFVTVAMAMVSCGPASSSTGGPGPEIEVASDFPVSPGVLASGGVGLALQHAAQLAIDEHPTVRGLRLKLIPFDYSSAQNPRAKPLQDMERMVEDPRILGMVGPYNSFVAQAQIPLANAANLVIISPATTDDCLTLPLPDCQPPPASLRPSGTNNYFRLAATDSSQARAMAHFAVRTLGVHKVAVFSDGTRYGRTLAKDFSAAVTAVQGTVVLSRDFDPSTVNFTSWLGEARDAGAEAIYAGGSDGTRTCTVRVQMRDIFTNDLYFLGPDAIVTPRCLDQAHDNLSDRIYGTVSLAAASASSPEAARVLQKLQEEYPGDHQPVPYALATYDSTSILIDAIGRAIDAAGGRMPTRLQVLEAVAQTKAFKGVTGTYSFTPAGDPQVGTVSVYQVRGRVWAPVTTGGS